MGDCLVAEGEQEVNTPLRSAQLVASATVTKRLMPLIPLMVLLLVMAAPAQTRAAGAAMVTISARVEVRPPCTVGPSDGDGLFPGWSPWGALASMSRMQAPSFPPGTASPRIVEWAGRGVARKAPGSFAAGRSRTWWSEVGRVFRLQG